MKNIKRWFENDTINSDQHYNICEYDGHLEAKTDSALFMAVSPSHLIDGRIQQP